MSIKLQEEYGDDLQVLFVEVQGREPDVPFALKKKWLGGRAMWTTERPFNLGLTGIPNFGLIAPDGEMVLSGYTLQHTSEIEERIEEMVKSANKPSKDLPKDVGKALVDANKGAYAKALEALDDVLADEKAAEDHAAAQEARAEVVRRVESQLRRADWLLSNGYPLEGEELVDDLAKGLKGPKGIDLGAEKLAAFESRLASDEMKAELSAAKSLAKLEEKLFEDGPDEKAQSKLFKLAEKHAGTKVAERATELAKIAG